MVIYIYQKFYLQINLKKQKVFISLRNELPVWKNPRISIWKEILEKNKEIVTL